MDAKRRQRQKGVGLVEFALAAPVAFLLLLGLLVVSVVVVDQIQLNNAARDGARAAAVCGGRYRDGTSKLPDGSAICSATTVSTYLSQQANALHSGSSVNLTVYPKAGGSSTNLDDCGAGGSLDVQATYAQPLYLPLISTVFGTNGASTRTLTADARMACEQ